MYRISQENLIPQPGRGPAQILRLPAACGSGESASYPFEPGFSYIDTCYVSRQAFSVANRFSDDEPKIVLTLALSGKSSFIGPSCEMAFKAGHATLTAFRGSQGERQYAAAENLRQLRFIVTPSWLENHGCVAPEARIWRAAAPQILEGWKIGAQTLAAASELARLDPNRPLDLARMHGQALLIVATELERLTPRPRAGHPISPGQRAIAETARDILISEYANPPGVAELSKRVGVNPQKLKLLFHHYFGNTPYGVLNAYKMQRARHLLQYGNLQINQIAWELGYRHPNNFTAAFTRYYGVTPKRMQTGAFQQTGGDQAE